MRELEFLPNWYNQTRRRKRVVKLMSWLTLAIVLGLSAWVLQTERNICTAERTLGLLKGQLAQSKAEQLMLDEQLRLRKELQSQEQLIASLGYPVEMTRLLQSLDALMPREMSMTEFNCETTEESVQQQGVSVASLKTSAEQKLVDRKLKVKVAGIAPSDVDVTNFMIGLNKLTFLDQVGLSYIRGRNDSGRLLREFEVTFTMNLNQPELPESNGTYVSGE